MKSVALLLIWVLSTAAAENEVKLSKEFYKPIFREPGEIGESVGPLWVDKTPVTNGEFLLFIKSHPALSKSKIPRLYADDGYLSHWSGDTTFVKSETNFPVTYISWFVARKYCASQGKRLPTIAEWEIASDAQNPKNESKILNWYAKPGAKLADVGKGPGNRFGVKDAHGLIWEWVDNFAEVIMSGDSRGGSATESLFCGGAALKARDPKLYASFVRFAFRSSLTARYTSANLGFRCVRDDKDGSK